METAPLLLGKRALHHAYPDRAAAERRSKLTGLPPGNDLPPPTSTLTETPTVVCCSGALQTPQRLAASPTGTVRFKQFASSDPFVLLNQSVARQPVAVVQSLGTGHESSSLRLVEALQTLWAARAAGSQEHLDLNLPASCDPQRDPSPFNRLIVTLAKASGAREVHYCAELGAADAVSHVATAQADIAAAVEQGSSRERLDALARLAHEQAKQAGRRGMGLAEKTWHALAQQASVRACDAPVIASTDCVVFGVQANAALRDAVAAQLAERVDARVGEHRLVDAASPAVELATQVEGKHVVIVHSLRPAPTGRSSAPYQGGPAMCIEALLLAQAARDAGAAKVTVVQAYQMNGRSDVEAHDAAGTTAGAYCNLVARWFDAVRTDAAVLVECHDMHTPGAWSSAKHAHPAVIDGVRILVDDLFAQLSEHERGRTVLALPDAGSVKRTKLLQPLFSHVYKGDKIRTDHEGDCKLKGIGGGDIPSDAVVVLSDDETATGSTLAQTLTMLREKGANTVHALLVHNIMPLDPFIRNLHLAWFRACGATSLRFSDTHGMGPVVDSYDALLALHDNPEQARSEVATFCAQKGITSSPESLFKDLAADVHVISTAPAIARAVVCEEPTHGLGRAKNLFNNAVDFPKPGIVFREMSPLLRDPDARRSVIQEMAQHYRNLGVTQIAALQSRGYIFGAPLAEALKCGLVMVRKPGKVPGPLHEVSYSLEYGKDSLVIPKTALQPQDRVLVVDDLIATGGSANAAVELVRRAGATPVGVGTMMELDGLAGREALGDVPLHSVFTV